MSVGQSASYVVVQHCCQISATVRYTFGHNAELKIMYFMNGLDLCRCR